MRVTEEIFTEILEKRGICSEEQISEFLDKKPKFTYDPLLLSQMDAGVDLILSFIEKKKRICVFGDYDVDGITSTCIVLTFLKHLNADVEYYVPSRFDEGYGLNMDAVKYLHSTGVELIITVDCGSASYEEIEFAKSLGMEIVVTDHHSITDKRADCIIINPKKQECEYPFKELAGCGVAFKLCQAIQRKTNLPKAVLNSLLDLVAIGTVGDVVPLIDENRTLVKYGIEMLKKSERAGMVRLIDRLNFDKSIIKSVNIAFGIVPHINATGRMENAKVGVQLILETDDAQAENIVEQVIQINNHRKEVQEEVLNLCENIIDNISSEQHFLIIDCPEAHEGICGIVAGRLKEKHNKPIIIFTKSGEGYVKGTGRSIKKIDLYNLLNEQEELFEKFGGHHGACGLTMKRENLKILSENLENELENRLSKDPLLFYKNLEYDSTIDLKELTLELVSRIEEMEPFGHGNERPRLLIKIEKVKTILNMGRDNRHMKLIEQTLDGETVSLILFNKTSEQMKLIKKGCSLTVIGTPEINYWNNKSQVQVIINEIIAAE